MLPKRDEHGKKNNIETGSFIEQTFTQITDTESEAEDFGEEAAKITTAFLNGYGANSD
jgi:hypothetical protein